MPLIHTLRHCTASEKVKIAEVVEKDALEEDDFTAVFELVHRYGGIDHAVTVAKEHVTRCKAYLDAFEDSPEKNALVSLADYVVTRVK